jgi:hypothetical protein
MTAFKLGRAGAEATFPINPTQYNPTDRRIADQFRAADGSLCDVTLATGRSPVRIPGNYITPTFWNQLRALIAIDDVALVFEPFTGEAGIVMENWQQRTVPKTTTSLKLKDNSILLADRLRYAAGAAPLVKLIALMSAGSTSGGRLGGGIDYLSRVSNPNTWHSDSILTFSPALPSVAALYVSYSTTGYAVRANRIPAIMQGGQVDQTRYDLELAGA